MIPKIIHYCWLSGEEYPKNIKACLDTWKKLLPEYEFVLWDTNKFDITSTLWTQQAFEKKKYAFVADYIRLYAVYNYGGIYLDTDVEVIKKFDDLLDLPYFIGMELNEIIEAAIFGAEKGTPWVKDCLDYYTNRAFIKDNGTMDYEILPNIIKEQLEKKKTLIEIAPDSISTLRNNITNADKFYLFPFEFFSPRQHETSETLLTENTYTIHYFNNYWLPVRQKYRRKLKRKFIRLFGVKSTENMIFFTGFRRLKRIFNGAFSK